MEIKLVRGVVESLNLVSVHLKKTREEPCIDMGIEHIFHQRQVLIETGDYLDKNKNIDILKYPSL